jgi:hypothetical protein
VTQPEAEARLLRRIGARVLSEANDLKRTPHALANDLGEPVEAVQAVIDGEAGLECARDLVQRMTAIYPISLRSLWLDGDDTDGGVKIVTATESKSSARVFDRKDADGAVTPYYEYRDTAMSRAAPFKPEWIREIRLVSDADPDNPDVAYNNGHLMHQTTFFVGPVNFYWQNEGVRHCAEMTTGDSNYITPFVPHSFASRDADELGLIIAVTYGAGVANALDEFMAMGSEGAERLCGRMGDASGFAARLRRYMAAESMSPAELAKRMQSHGIDAPRALALSDASAEPTAEEIEVVANCLSVRACDIMGAPFVGSERVVVRRAAETEARLYPAAGDAPAYRIKELARTRHQPFLKGFDVAVLSTDVQGVFEHGLHEYVYNYGAVPVELVWNTTRKVVLQPGDSAYVQPMVNHAFRCLGGEDEGQLVVIRIPGRLTDSTLDEYASFDPSNRHRVSGETKRWF